MTAISVERQLAITGVGVEKSLSEKTVADLGNEKVAKVAFRASKCDEIYERFPRMSFQQPQADAKQIVSGQSDSWKQLCPFILKAAPKYSIYGVQQLPRNRNERL
jgi:hypothetical protein